MKQIKLLGLMLLLGATMIITSCGDEIIDPPGTGNDGPQVNLVEELGYVSSDIELNPGETFTVKVEATSDEALLSAFSIEQDGERIDPSRFTINGATPGSALVALFGDDETSFIYEVDVIAHADMSESTYAFVVIDDNQETGSTSIFVNTDPEVVNSGESPDVVVGGNASVDLDAGALYSINLSATPLNGTLQSIAVYEDNVLISDLSRLEFAGTDFDANGYILPSQFVDGFTDEKLFIRVQDSGSSVYRVEIADSFGQATSFEKTVNVEEVVTGTPVELDEGVLLNQAGITGTGGLDLDNGNGTGSMDSEAEIRDNGIDGGPVATNWLQTISTVNGSTIKSVIPGQGNVLEGFTFASAETVETINDLHNSNSTIYAGSVVLVGDMFTVQRADGKTYLLVVTAINNTTADNLDSYTFSIKR